MIFSCSYFPFPLVGSRACFVCRRLMPLHDRLEQCLAGCALGTFPAVRKCLEGRPPRDAVIQISFGRVIDITADGASPHGHGTYSPFTKIRLESSGRGRHESSNTAQLGWLRGFLPALCPICFDDSLYHPLISKEPSCRARICQPAFATKSRSFPGGFLSKSFIPLPDSSPVLLSGYRCLPFGIMCFILCGPL